LDAVRRTAAGERVWFLGGKVGEPRSYAYVDAVPEGVRLTPKEREVLVLMLRGCSNAEMVEKLFLSLPTVRTHVRNILRKLGAKNRRELFHPHDLETAGL
jgi:DNA-binding CsgD family transcriptional regulator